MGKTPYLKPLFFLSFNLYSKVELPEFPEDAYPDVPEMDPIKEKIKSFVTTWKSLEAAFTDSSIQVFHLEIAGKTPEELLQKAVETMESKGYTPNIYCQEQVMLLKALYKFKAFLDGPIK